MKISIYDKGATAKELQITVGCTKDVYKEFVRQHTATKRWLASKGILEKLQRYFESEYPDRYEKGTAKDWKQINKMTYDWAKVVKPEKMEALLNKWYIISGAHAGGKVLDDLKIKAQFNLRNPEIIGALRERGTKITGSITQKTLTDFRRVLTKSYAKSGSSPYLIQKEIKGMFKETYKNRAKTIARTETAIARATVKDETYTRNGIQFKKWEPKIDEVTRDWHKIHTKVKTTEDFIVGGEAMKHAHDPNASAKNVVNCRCATLYFSDLSKPFKPQKTVFTGGGDVPLETVRRGPTFRDGSGGRAIRSLSPLGPGQLPPGQTARMRQAREALARQALGRQSPGGGGLDTGLFGGRTVEQRAFARAGSMDEFMDRLRKRGYNPDTVVGMNKIISEFSKNITAHTGILHPTLFAKQALTLRRASQTDFTNKQLLQTLRVVRNEAIAINTKILPEGVSLSSIVQEIKYVPVRMARVRGVETARRETMMSTTLSKTDKSITIYETGLTSGTKRFDESFRHEVGHRYYTNEAVRKKWESLVPSKVSPDPLRKYDLDKRNQIGQGSSFISHYARTNIAEDFAETFALGTVSPRTARRVVLQKWDIMKTFLREDIKQVPVVGGSGHTRIGRTIEEFVKWLLKSFLKGLKKR